MDLTIIVALGGLAVAAIAIVSFWMNFSDRISAAKAAADRAEARADEALRDAAEAKKLVDEAHTRITALAAEFGIYRERVALDFAAKETVRDLKTELVGAIDKLGGKLDDFLRAERMDRHRA
jgi:hypothetical protein